MSEVLLKYLPEHAVEPVFELIKTNSVHLKIVNERVTRHGDYRRHPSGKHQITVNANLNKYRFLITLVHEIAHLAAFEKLRESYATDGMFDVDPVLNAWRAQARLKGYGPMGRPALERLYSNAFASKSKVKFAV